MWPQAHIPGLFPRRELDMGALLILTLRRLPCISELHVPRAGSDTRPPMRAQVNLKERDGFVIAPFTVRTVPAHQGLVAICVAAHSLVQYAALWC